MSDKIKSLIENISRRSLLGKLAAATSGVVLAFVGSSKPAQAQSHCCLGLCMWPNEDSCNEAICAWNWSCCDGNGNRWACSDQFRSIQYNCEDCIEVVCSTAIQWGSC
jgi:hypothetical protein